eukprot:Gb_29802 [translate_table: standard]
MMMHRNRRHRKNDTPEKGPERVPTMDSREKCRKHSLF